MKAAVVEEPGRLVVREVPEPVMGDYDCLVQGLYGATCSGTDLHLLNAHPLFGVRYPTVLGHESIGRVLEIGPKVENFKVGDMVTRMFNRNWDGLRSHWGGFAERGLVYDWEPKKRDGLPLEFSPDIHRVLPPDTDPARATMIITWRETLSFITRVGVTQGAKVLVIGSGGNAMSMVNHAVNLGAETVLAVGGPAREAEMRRVGATHFLSYREDDLVAAGKAQGLENFDLIVDAVCKVGQIDRVLPLLRPRGMVTIYGRDDWGKVTINPLGVSQGFTFANYDYAEGETHEQVLEFIRQGRLRAEDYLGLDHIFTLDETNEALEAIRQRKVVKALVKLS